MERQQNLHDIFTIFNVAENEHVVSVAKIDESEEEDSELDGGDELAHVDGGVSGEEEQSPPIQSRRRNEERWAAPGVRTQTHVQRRL